MAVHGADLAFTFAFRGGWAQSSAAIRRRDFRMRSCWKASPAHRASAALRCPTLHFGMAVCTDQTSDPAAAFGCGPALPWLDSRRSRCRRGDAVHPSAGCTTWTLLRIGRRTVLTCLNVAAVIALIDRLFPRAPACATAQAGGGQPIRSTSHTMLFVVLARVQPR